MQMCTVDSRNRFWGLGSAERTFLGWKSTVTGSSIMECDTTCTPTSMKRKTQLPWQKKNEYLVTCSQPLKKHTCGTPERMNTQPIPLCPQRVQQEVCFMKPRRHTCACLRHGATQKEHVWKTIQVHTAPRQRCLKGTGSESPTEPSRRDVTGTAQWQGCKSGSLDSPVGVCIGETPARRPLWNGNAVQNDCHAKLGAERRLPSLALQHMMRSSQHT